MGLGKDKILLQSKCQWLSLATEYPQLREQDTQPQQAQLVWDLLDRSKAKYRLFLLTVIRL